MKTGKAFSRRNMVVIGAMLLAGVLAGCGGSSSGGGDEIDPGSGGGGADMTAPNSGGAPSFSNLTTTSFTLQWPAATDTVSLSGDICYRIYMANTSGGQNFSMPTRTTAAGVTSSNFSGLVSNTTYYIVVRPLDEADNENTNTNEGMVTTLNIPDVTNPTFDSTVTVAAVGSSAVNVSWTPAATDNVTNSNNMIYRVYLAQAMDGQNFTTPHATSAPGASSVQVGGLMAETTYYAKVRAVDEAGNFTTSSSEGMATTGAASLTFLADVWPIFDANDGVYASDYGCNSSGCHGGGSAQNGVNLNDAATAYARLVNMSSPDCAGSTLVVPGDSANSFLIDLLSVSPPCGTSPVGNMPQAIALPPALVEIVSDWIDAGAPYQ